MITIHKVTQADLQDLRKLYLQLTGTLPAADQIEKAFARLDKREDVFLAGAYDDSGHLIASSQLTRCPDLTDDTRCYYSMENFVVDDQMRGKGIGTLLLNYLEQYVIDHDGRYINFTSSSSRTQAHHFYQKNGYPVDVVKGFKKEFPS